ncbi:translocation/assembly module TamB domain-containing protein [Moraxella bovis]|uniref:translocation/assembly module TamB domain-containing protein n=1 Tax=Moraxella bovis TaxID=476 RepID=UPI00222676C4|nr:translocation/assembly module TamB domain-containing protein [Moraxella bovis]UZA34196.1 translocation/assembly module TamB domain-containing protein [Moraxella bovis]
MTDHKPTDPQNATPDDKAGTDLSHQSGTNPSHTPPKPKWQVYLIRLFVAIIIVLVLIFALLFYAISTETGTKFVLEKIATETGTKLSYGKGSLRGGVWVNDVIIAQGEDMEIKVNQAYVKLGWQAVFARQVHLAEASIDKLDIINHKPPTGEPFDYATIDLPVSLRLQNTTASTVSYTQKNSKGGYKDAIYLYDIALVDGKWAGTDVHIKGGSLDFNHDVSVSNVNGEIRLTGDYPLSATADVKVPALDKAYFDILHATAKGTLKRTHGKVTSKYNKHDIHGEFVAQGLDDGSPFSAKLYVNHVVLPYAEEQNITIKDGIITADGVVERIELRMNADLAGRDIPAGRYYGRGVVRDGGMDIEALTADTPSGQLHADGNMAWSDEFMMDVTVRGDGVRVREFMPVEYTDYQAYLPTVLDGALDFQYFYLDKATNETRLAFDLAQKDGERVQATLAQSQDSPNAPWRVHADWQNLVRAGVPNIDNINSPHGTASIRLEEGRTYIEGKANIKALSVAPVGGYDIRANIEKGERIHLTDFHYQGELGDLTGTGRIDLATTSTPLAWQFDLATDGFMPNAYFDTPDKTPFSLIKGTILATGRMREDKQNTKVRTNRASSPKEPNHTRQSHEINIIRSDLTATLADDSTMTLSGEGKALVQIVGSDVSHFTTDFKGKFGQSLLPKIGTGDILLGVHGDLDKMNISTLNYRTPKGRLSGSGVLTLAQGIGWDIKARLDEIDTSAVVDNTSLLAVITGDMSSIGSYQDGKLGKLTAKFDGQVAHDDIPDGQLAVDVSGEDNRFVVHRLEHTGEAGELSASGTVDVGQMAWDLTAKMNALNIGRFVRDMDSELTGGFTTTGRWGRDIQRIAIDGLALTGVMRGQNVTATGSLSGEFDLPDDLGGYIGSLKTSPDSFDLQSITDFQRQLKQNTKQTRQIIRKLNADKVQVRMGDNVASMHGNEQNLTTALNLTDLSQLIPSARGAIKGGVILVDNRTELPTIYVDLNANDVRTADVIVQKASVVGKIVNLGNAPSQLLAEVSDIIAMGRVVNSARFDFKGTQDKHELALTTKNAQVEARAKVVGGFNRRTKTYQGVLGEGRMETRFGLLSQRQPTEFKIGLDKSLQIAPHCWQTSKTHAGGTGSLCLQDTLVYTPNEIKADLVVQDLDTSVLSPAMPSDIFWHSKLNGKAKISHKKGNTSPQINAVLYSDNGRLGLYGDDTGYVEMPYERISVIAQSTPTGLKLRADVAGTIGEGYADVLMNPFTDDKPISGAVVINGIDLAVVRPFLPSLKALSGNVTLQGGVGGTLSRPLFYGNAELTDGHLAVMDVPLDLTNINLSAQVSGTQATLAGDFVGGQGQGVLTGQVDWQQELQAKVNISADDLTISSPPMVVAQVSPDLEVVVRPSSRYVDIKGVVVIPSATIRPPEAQGDVVVQSPDVSVLDRRLSGKVEQILAVSAPWSINADIGLDLGDDVTFRGFGARLPLAGALHLTQSGQGKTQARGMIQVSERTKIDGIGQNLELNYAQVRFNGDMLNPRLSIEAEKEIEGQTVGVRIKGTANAPDISVFNNAGLSEQQAMNAIITGRLSPSADSQISEQGFRSQVTNNLAAAGLSLGLSGTRGLTNQIGSALGFESLTVDASGNSSDTHVNVTGYITPDLYIRYGVGVFNAETELSMRYQLTRRVYVQATSATENMVDVIYRWRF